MFTPCPWLQLFLHEELVIFYLKIVNFHDSAAKVASKNLTETHIIQVKGFKFHSVLNLI